jgi:23S rRNA (guanosine2251-2'-O)-methyltransferase
MSKKTKKRECILVLDNLRSVFNVASLFRSANGAGITSIICCGTTPTPTDRFDRLREDFEKVSLGAQNAIAWEYAENTKKTIKELKKQDFYVCAIEQNKNSIVYSDFSFKKEEKVVLVLGTEVTGIDKKVIALCDGCLEIPMLGSKESLNVCIAGSIVMYERLRQITKNK